MAGPAFDLVALDIDGTLMDSRDRLRPGVREALARVHAAGLHVVLCTGRRFSTTMEARRELGPSADVAICSGGSAVKRVETGESLHTCPLGRARARAVCAWMRESGLVPIVLPDRPGEGRDLCVSELDRAALEGGAKPYFERYGRYIHFYAGEFPLGEAAILECYTVDAEGPVEAAAARAPAAFGREMSVLKMRQWRYGTAQVAYEFLNREATKASALRWLLADRGIPAERVIAFGDDLNDIPMLELAGVGVAMGNAGEAVRAAADEETLDCDHEGVAVGLRRLLPELF